MAFNATCPTCAARLRVEERLIGQTRKCPKCGERFQIQDESGQPEPDFPIRDDQLATQDSSSEPKSKLLSVDFVSRFAELVHQKRTLSVTAAIALIVCVGLFIHWSRSEDLDGTEAGARAVLVTALDCWVLGDSQKKFAAEHREISFQDMDFLRGLTLSRYAVNRPYRVVPHRESKNMKLTEAIYETPVGGLAKSKYSHQFSVTLFVAGKNGTSEEPTVYMVTQMYAGVWGIYNMGHENLIGSRTR